MPSFPPVTREDCLNYLGIADADDQLVCRNVELARQAATEMLRGSVDYDIATYFPEHDARIHKLVLAYMAELYEDRGTTAKAVKAKHAWVHDMEMQLRLEIARKKREAAT